MDMKPSFFIRSSARACERNFQRSHCGTNYGEQPSSCYPREFWISNLLGMNARFLGALTPMLRVINGTGHGPVFMMAKIFDVLVTGFRRGLPAPHNPGQA